MNLDIKRRIRRSRESERHLGKWLLRHDGEDPHWRNISSSTGRVGHITGLQFDCVSQSYVAENKQVKVPAMLAKWWLQINQVALTHRKEPLLRIEPTNTKVGLASLRIPTLHVITEERHAELLRLAELGQRYEDLRDS